ncbi:MAG TPA: alkane 1-monooxygenase [Chitinophagaceae bacterium]|nr:alkane 1-monooxygenase [Chitinophagaceae bacterium]
MSVRAFKYLSPLILYAGAYHAFSARGWTIWLPLLYAWVLIPLAELLIRPDPSNLEAAEEQLAREDRTYDVILYLVVLAQYAALVQFLYGMFRDRLAWPEAVGRIWVMGLLCGTFGINVGHELGHRTGRFEQVLARMLLLTSLYMHFFIEHNRGHHKRVATPEDPSSARYGEWIYAFYLRTVWGSYRSAWEIAGREQRRKGRPVFSLHNEMIQYHLIEAALVLLIGIVAGWQVMLCFVAAAGIGILLLETVNYIEHYGLRRRALGEGRYERAQPWHSWNSDHVIGRLMLFELCRHSDHHYQASRKYQVLRHHPQAPQMPTGYPGMMMLALFPPAWFYVMNPRVRRLQEA